MRGQAEILMLTTYMLGFKLFQNIDKQDIYMYEDEDVILTILVVFRKDQLLCLMNENYTNPGFFAAFNLQRKTCLGFTYKTRWQFTWPCGQALHWDTTNDYEI